MMIKEKNILSFGIGDVVIIKDTGEKSVITGTKMIQGDIEYSVNNCSWFTLPELKFIHRATKGSMEITKKMDEERMDEE
jgi:uncharacterized protein YodC (DUF2158 family)